MTDPTTTLVVVVSDTHTNSAAGLIPPRFLLRDGGEHRASNKQIDELWHPWLALWTYILERKKRTGCRVLGIFNGDGPDRNWHTSGYELVALHRDDIIKMTVQVLRPMRHVCDAFIYNRGTEAHEGGTGELAESVAKELDVIPSPDTPALTHYWPLLDVDGVLIRAGHNPISTSTRENTRDGGAMRSALDLYAAHMRMGDPVPQVVVFSHTHHWERYEGSCPIKCIYTPCWSLPGAYSYRRGLAYKREPVGAWLIECSQGKATIDKWAWPLTPSVAMVV